MLNSTEPAIVEQITPSISKIQAGNQAQTISQDQTVGQLEPEACHRSRLYQR